jgi:cyanidin-3-O-glucoside 2''-O-glucuronosyltransferase
MVDVRHRSMRVVMLPWLAHGHIFPFLELAKKLTHRNFHIYICSTPVLVNSIKPKLSHHPNNYSNSIEAVELHLPSIPELPPHHHTTKGLPPHLMPTLMKALDMTDTRANFSNIVESVKPDLIIHDFLPSWVTEVASSLNIPTIAFLTSGATVFSFGFHHSQKKDEEYPFPEIYTDSLKKKIMKMAETSYATNNGKGLQFYERSCKIVLMKSFRELEGKYMDYLSASFGKKVVPVGPLVQEPVHDDNEGIDIINWLNKKEKSSTVYVSFGSECYPSKEDMEEIAHGLELSNVNFIWVVRFPEGDKMKLDEALPDGYLGRIGDRGIVVENWAPQLKILDHSSIGGFVSHCGWGSLMESIKFGIPVIAIPMQHDQPWNARLAEVSDVGVEVKRDDSDRLCRENVAKVIKQVVVEKYGEDIRRKTKEMKYNIIRKVEEEIDEVVKEILQVVEM